MGMAIDQAGHDQAAPAVDNVGAGEAGAQLRRGADGEEGVALDGQGAVLDLRHGVIQAQQGAAQDQGIHVVHGVRFLRGQVEDLSGAPAICRPQ